MKTIRKILAIVALLEILIYSETSPGLTITLTDVGSTAMTAQQLNAFGEGAKVWEGLFRDPVTVNINIAFDNLPAGVLGSTKTARTTHPYTTVRAAMVSDAVGVTEQNAMNSLPATSVRITDINGTRNDTSVTLATANAKALGLGTGLDTTYANPVVGVDAEIKFANAFASSFDYDPTDGISASRYDFVGVVTHEIGHALGFFSMTDVQDFNPGFTLHPTTLDLYRFVETGGAHSLPTGVRRVTSGSAEYYDTYLNDIPLSHGSMDTTDPACNSSGGSCQASHWSDDRGNLMDPSVARGVLQTIKPNDTQALDYIGWNRRLFIDPRLLRRFLIGWFRTPEIFEPPRFGGEFDDFPPLPPPEMIPDPPQFDPDQLFPKRVMGLRAGFDFGDEGLDRRSGLGYAVFAPSVPIKPEVVEPVLPEKAWEYIDPPGEPATEIPANLSEVFIQSDIKGIPFVFRSTCGENGCPFDPSLGDFGGYRVPGFLDGEGDMQTGDVDGKITLVMLALDESGEPDPDGQNLFYAKEDNPDNNIIILDKAAIGALLPAQCGDINHPIPAADLDGNCIVDARDLALFADEWLKCTAPICP